MFGRIWVCDNAENAVIGIKNIREVQTQHSIKC